MDTAKAAANLLTIRIRSELEFLKRVSRLAPEQNWRASGDVLSGGKNTQSGIPDLLKLCRLPYLEGHNPSVKTTQLVDVHERVILRATFGRAVVMKGSKWNHVAWIERLEIVREVLHLRRFDPLDGRQGLVEKFARMIEVIQKHRNRTNLLR